jgi:hypothetical protein
MNHVAALHAADVVSQSESGGKAKSVIFVFLSGGLTQHDSFDPKPDAPVDIRGEFSPIATQTPGVSICERLQPALEPDSIAHDAVQRTLAGSELQDGSPEPSRPRFAQDGTRVTFGDRRAHSSDRGTQTTSGLAIRSYLILRNSAKLFGRFSFAARLTQKFVQFPCAVCKGWALDTRSVQHGDE